MGNELHLREVEDVQRLLEENSGELFKMIYEMRELQKGKHPSVVGAAIIDAATCYIESFRTPAIRARVLGVLLHGIIDSVKEQEQRK